MARIQQPRVEDQRCSCLDPRAHQCVLKRTRAPKYQHPSFKARYPAGNREPFVSLIEIESQLASIEGPGSPESSYSVVSHDYSVSSTTAELDYQRHLSPALATPTSSEISFSYPVPRGNAQEQQSGTFGHYPERRPSLSPNYQSHHFSSLDNATNPLAGIDYTPRPDESVQRPVEFISRYGPSPTRLQAYPQILEPWTGHPLRSDDPMLLDSPSELTLSPETAQSPTSSIERGSRRIGPLTAAQRRNANAVRQVRACLRCSYMKETCNDSNPCKNCESKKNGRKWRLGCIREHLHERISFLFPDKLKARYDHTIVNNFISGSAWCYSDRQEFLVNLETGLAGRPLRVQVKEIELLNPESTQLFGFQATTDPQDRRTHLEPVWNPPIALYFPDMTTASSKIRQQVGILCNDVLFARGQEAGSYNAHSIWPWPCFDFDVLYWGGDILEIIHEYLQPELDGHDLLRTALCLPFFAYILNHPFKIPQDDIPGFLQQLSQPPPLSAIQGRTITPEITNRFVRMLLFPLIYNISGEVLKGLHKILHGMAQKKETSVAQSDLAFCLAFLMTMFIGKMQDIVHQLSILNDQEAHIGISRDEAWSMITNVENHLATYIIYFHSFALSRRRPPTLSESISVRPADIHAAEFKLSERVKQKMETARASAYLHPHQNDSIAELLSAGNEHPKTLDLGELFTDTFTKWNTHRLCWKLCEAAFGAT